MSIFTERLRALRVAEEQAAADRERERQESLSVQEKQRREEQARELTRLEELFNSHKFLKQTILPILQTVNQEYLRGAGFISYSDLPDSLEEFIEEYEKTKSLFGIGSIQLSWKDPAMHELYVLVHKTYVSAHGKAEDPDKRLGEINPQQEGWQDKLEARILEILEDPKKSRVPSEPEKSWTHIL